MKEFKRKYRKGSDKPILLIVWKEMFMSFNAQEFGIALRDFNQLFDVFYCSDEKEVKKYFHSYLPMDFPHVYIIDKTTQEITNRDGTTSEQ